MKILLVSPRGFCAGVNMAIEALERAIELFGTPLYVFHEIVHNRHVVDRFREKGVVFVDHLHEVPSGSHLMYSAHGISPAVHKEAQQRNLHVVDATCPLVRKVHLEAIRFARLGYTIVLIGHRGHDEVVGTLGEAPEQITLVETLQDVDRLEVPDPNKVAYLTQTTLSVDDTREVIEALKKRFPKISGPDVKDICYATQNRQAAVRALAEDVQLILVVGARNSSNSNRLREIGEEMGVPTYLVEDASDLNHGWFEGVERVGVTAGASSPEQLVRELFAKLQEFSDVELKFQKGIKETVRFKLPEELVRAGEDGRTPGRDQIIAP